jgi:hypothetical protein
LQALLKTQTKKKKKKKKKAAATAHVLTFSSFKKQHTYILSNSQMTLD